MRQMNVMPEDPNIVSARLAARDLDRAMGRRVKVTSEHLIVDFTDGRTISAPLTWFPRLMHATPRERRNVELSYGGAHWPDLDEDVSYRGLLLGRRGRENPRFFRFWLSNRKQGRLVTLEDWTRERKRREPPKARARSR